MKLHQTIMRLQSLLFILASVYGIKHVKEKLLFSTSQHLKEKDIATGVVRTLTSQNDYFYSMAYDHKDRYMYVPGFNTGNIMRFPYPNNQTVILEVIVSTATPIAITFDSVNRHVYWTNTFSPGRIMRCNPDGSNVTVLLNETTPCALTLDIQNRWIYYGQHITPSEIYRINFDGMDKRVIIKNLQTYVFGIEIDFNVKRLYWMEYNTGDLKSACFNGSDVKTIISTNVRSQNWDIDMDEDFIFYTSYNQIFKINKFLGQIPTVVHNDTQQVYGLLFYKPEVLTTSTGRADRSKRSFFNMYRQISHLFQMGNTFENYLRDYECWCGVGGSSTPQDNMYRCCMVHDRCYDQNSRDGCSGIHLDDYSYEWTSVSIRCTNSPGSCDYKNCKCDKKFLECLRSAGFPRTFLPGLRNFNTC